MTNRNNLSDQERQYRSNLENNDRLEPTEQTTAYTENHNPEYTTEIEPDTIHTRPPTPDEVAYHNGYVDGQQRELFHEDIQRTRAENSAATGAVVGLIIASIAGLVLATLYFLTQERQPQISPAPSVSPVQPQASPQPQDTRPTVIERVREVPSSPQNTEVIIAPGLSSPSPQPNPTQPNVTQPGTTQPSLTQPTTQPNLTQPAPGVTSSEPVPDATSPVDPNSSDPNQSLSQPDSTSNGTGTVGQ